MELRYLYWGKSLNVSWRGVMCRLTATSCGRKHPQRIHSLTHNWQRIEPLSIFQRLPFQKHVRKGQSVTSMPIVSTSPLNATRRQKTLSPPASSLNRLPSCSIAGFGNRVRLNAVEFRGLLLYCAASDPSELLPVPRSSLDHFRVDNFFSPSAVMEPFSLNVSD